MFLNILHPRGQGKLSFLYVVLEGYVCDYNKSFLLTDKTILFPFTLNLEPPETNKNKRLNHYNYSHCFIGFYESILSSSPPLCSWSKYFAYNWKAFSSFPLFLQDKQRSSACLQSSAWLGPAFLCSTPKTMTLLVSGISYKWSFLPGCSQPPPHSPPLLLFHLTTWPLLVLMLEPIL